MLRTRAFIDLRPFLVAILAAGLAFGGLVPVASAQRGVAEKSQGSASRHPAYVEGEVLVKYKKAIVNLETAAGRSSSRDFAAIRQLEKLEDLRKGNVSRLKITDGKSVEQKVAELKKDPLVEYAEPNYRRELADIPTNDTSRALLWGLDNTGQT